MISDIIYACFIWAIIIFVLSCVKNVVIDNIVFSKWKKQNRIEKDFRKESIIIACLSDIIALMVTMILNAVFKGYTFTVMDMLAASASPMYYKITGVLVAGLCILIYYLKRFDIPKKYVIILTIINAPYFFLIPITDIVQDYRLYNLLSVF